MGAGSEGINCGEKEAAGSVSGGAVVVDVDGCIGVLQTKFRDKGEAVDLEVGREGRGYEAGGSWKTGTFFVVEIFCAEGKAEPGFGIDVEIEGRTPPAMGGGVFLACQAGLVDAAVKAEAEEGAGPCC